MEEINQNLVDLLNEWKTQHVWKGTIEERKEKFRWIHEHMKILFDKPDLTLEFADITEESDAMDGASGQSYYAPMQDLICIVGKLSVITLLHEWGHALGKENVQEWAFLHFKQAFPKSASRLVQLDNLYIKGDNRNTNANPNPTV